MEMWLYDRHDRKILFAWVDTVNDARELWCKIASIMADQNLCTFEVRDGDRVVYEGSYVTDEC